MDMLTGIRLFTEVVRANSFAAAGRRLGMVPSSVSRKINALEEALGARLLNRSTRKLSLTEAGQLYYEQATRILSELEDANLIIAQYTESPRGTLRISAPAAFGRLHVTPALSEFLRHYPEVRVDLMATDQRINMVEVGIDVALRSGPLENSSLVARKLASNRYVICASPAYLEHRGQPHTPQDLAYHNCLAYESARGPIVWTFKGATEPEHIEVAGNLQANSFGALKVAACRGLGLALLPSWSAMPCIKSGKLRTVLSNYSVFPNHAESNGAIYAVYPHRKYVSPKVRAFLDFMVNYIGDPPYWELEPGKRVDISLAQSREPR
ncbi:MAG TPA: LysR family transcriptional regulator [Gammaproteobacteria bacterium]|nr:LysR family transcriptional regulator [Gammaproteobacteria bacterium]